MPDSGVTITVRTRGTSQAKRELTGVSGAARAMGTSAIVAGRGLRNLKDSFNLSATAGYAFRRVAYVTGASLTGLGAIAIKSGLQFNASMESNQIAFTQFLGSSTAAKNELKTLFDLAAHTPFEMTNVTKAERQLLAFGFTAKSSNSWLQTIGDTIAGMGGGPEEIDSLVRALGQIKSKGRLQGDELMQLSELGVVNRTRLAKDLGVTPIQLQSGNSNIPAGKALAALKKQFDDTFGGQSAKQARSFNGQWSTLHDNISQTLGTLTGPLFHDLEGKVFPALNSTAERLNQIWSGGGTNQQKVALSRTAIRHRLGPLETEIQHGIEGMHLGDRLTTEFEKAVPKLADAAGHAAPKIAGALVTGFINAGPYGKMFALGLLLKKMGAFRALGSLAADAFVAKFAPKVAAAAAGEAVVGTAAGAGAGGKFGKGVGFGLAARTALRYGPKVARGAGPVGAAIGGAMLANQLAGQDTNTVEGAFEAGAKRQQGLAAALPPLPSRLGAAPQIIILKVGEKELTRVVHHGARKAKAHR